jgi:hypothetical protein
MYSALVSSVIPNRRPISRSIASRNNGDGEESLQKKPQKAFSIEIPRSARNDIPACQGNDMNGTP